MTMLYFRHFLFALLLVGASAARADYQWHSAGEFGAKPDRVHMLVDIGSIKAAEDGPFGARIAFIEMPVYYIYESANKPDYSRYELRAFCDATNSYAFGYAHTYWRNGRSSTEASEIPFSPGDAVLKSLASMMCGGKTAWATSDLLKPIPAQFAVDPYPSDYPWKALWLDSKVPTNTDPRTRADFDAEFNALKAQLEQQIAASGAKAEAVIDKQASEDAFWADQAVRRKQRGKYKLNRFLEGWLRKDEEYLIQQLGIPDNVYSSGATKYLWYDSRGNWSQVFVTTDEAGNVVNSARNDFWCNLTLELRDNSLIDFKLNGNSCDYGEFKR